MDRVAVFGASGTIGQATVRELVHAGYAATAFLRPARGTATQPPDTPGADLRHCEVIDASQDLERALAAGRYDVVISCLASRSGAPKDAWLVDYEANMNLLAAARGAGVRHFILLSAICVQKPRLAFQHAKLAFERELAAAGLTFTIARPTAFFKSLSGQIERVRQGKPYLLFGDGERTRCKPIGDADLAQYLVGCIDDPTRHDRILPIGGPGPAICPRQQGEILFALTGRPPRYRRISPGLFRLAGSALGLPGLLSTRFAAWSEYAKIAHYYATESMLVLDPESGVYDEAKTPETGQETLRAHYRAMLRTAGPANGAS
jgi:divinyl chlorophyllide a 8-vinyl-reductase